MKRVSKNKDMRNEREIFENELKISKIPFKGILLEDVNFKDILFEEYSKLDAKPNFRLYLNYHYPEEDQNADILEAREKIPVHSSGVRTMASTIPSSNFDKRYHKINDQYANEVLNNTLDLSFYSPNVEDADLFKNLVSINNRWEILRESVEKDNFDVYEETKLRGDSLVNAISEISNNYIQYIIAQILIKDNSTIHLFTADLSGYNLRFEEPNTKILNRWNELKDNINTILKKAFKPIQKSKEENTANEEEDTFNHKTIALTQYYLGNPITLENAKNFVSPKSERSLYNTYYNQAETSNRLAHHSKTTCRNVINKLEQVRILLPKEKTQKINNEINKLKEDYLNYH